jgi:hypothetical protein
MARTGRHGPQTKTIAFNSSTRPDDCAKRDPAQHKSAAASAGNNPGLPASDGVRYPTNLVGFAHPPAVRARSPEPLARSLKT